MRKIEDERDARRCLAAVRAAGGDAASWARAHGVDARSLNAWRVNLGRRPPAARLVELVAARVPHVHARYAVVIGEARFEFDDQVESETLSRVLQVMRSC